MKLDPTCWPRKGVMGRGGPGREMHFHRSGELSPGVAVLLTEPTCKGSLCTLSTQGPQKGGWCGGRKECVQVFAYMCVAVSVLGAEVREHTCSQGPSCMCDSGAVYSDGYHNLL